MRKIVLGVAAMATLFSFASCNSAPKATLETELDSLAYCYGLSTTRGLDMYLMQMGVDSTQMAAFVKGFLKATNGMSDSEKAEMVGMQIGEQVMQQMLPRFESLVNKFDSTAFKSDNYLAGFVAGIEKDDRILTVEEATQLIDAINERYEKVEHADWIAKNEQYLAGIKAKSNVKTTESGLCYEVLKAGKGEKPVATSKVKVHYHGTNIEGEVFDSSVDRGTPAEFGLNQVIKGWTEGLQLMSVGSKFRFYIPQDLAYGNREQGKIKPYSTLIFEVELLEIVK